MTAGSDSGKIGAVQLKGQDNIECDMLIMGVGVAPDTKFLADSGFSLEKDKGIAVDENLRVSGHENIFAVRVTLRNATRAALTNRACAGGRHCPLPAEPGPTPSCRALECWIQ